MDDEPSIRPIRRDELYVLLAESLVNAGRGPEAAQAFERSSHGVSRALAAKRKQRAADQLLRCGHIDAGITAMIPALRAFGLPTPQTPISSLLTCMMKRLKLKLRHKDLSWTPNDAPDPHDIERIDLAWNTAIGLLNVDHVRGFLYQTCSLSLALSAGDPFRIARSLIAEAVSLTALGGDPKTVDAMIHQAKQISDQLQSPYLNAFLIMLTGSVLFFRGQWQQAYDLHVHAGKLFKTIPQDVSWELATSDLVSRGAQLYVGLDDQSLEEIESSIARAQSRGNRYHAATNQSGITNIAWVMDDNIAQARRQTQESVRSWSQKGFHLQHYFDVIATTQIELYAGNGQAAYQHIRSRWQSIQTSQLLRAGINRAQSAEQLARAALGCIVSAGDTSRDIHRAAYQDARRCTRLLRKQSLT